MSKHEWPELSLAKWQDTYKTLHMWTQIVGKISLALTPPTNHYWNAALQVTAQGLATHLMTYRGRNLTLVFDFLKHDLKIICADGRIESLHLQPMTVAHFYSELMTRLRTMDIEVDIWKVPVEVVDPIPFDKDDQHRSYDRDRVSAFHQALMAIKPVMEEFRSDFVGKSSPVHFFWGSFDLAVTRFSGQRAPAKPEMGAVYAEAYSHEVISHGFWPGGPFPGGLKVEDAVFYAYAAPEPAGFAESKADPNAAYYDGNFHEFFLPYEAVRSAKSPRQDLIQFMKTTYDAAASLSKWDRGSLERSSAR